MNDKLVMLRLQHSQWIGQKFDVQHSESITADKGAESGSARLNKMIVPKAVINPTRRHFSAMKSWFIDQTSPLPGGWRVRPLHDIGKFKEAYNKWTDDADDLIHTLITDTYPKALENAPTRMGNLYNASDYPNPEELRYKFNISLDVQPMPKVSNHWLVKVDTFIKDAIEKTTKQTETNVANEPWIRMYQQLYRLHRSLVTRIGEEGATFKSVVVTSLPNICDTAKSLSVDPNEPELNSVITNITSQIATMDIKRSRTDDIYRKQMASKVKNVIKQIQDNLTDESSS